MYYLDFCIIEMFTNIILLLPQSLNKGKVQSKKLWVAFPGAVGTLMIQNILLYLRVAHEKYNYSLQHNFSSMRR